MHTKQSRFPLTLYTNTPGKEYLAELAQTEGATDAADFIAKALAHCSRAAKQDLATVKSRYNGRVPDWARTEAVGLSMSKEAFAALDALRRDLGLQSNAQLITLAVEVFVNRPGTGIIREGLPTFV